MTFWWLPPTKIRCQLSARSNCCFRHRRPRAALASSQASVWCPRPLLISSSLLTLKNQNWKRKYCYKLKHDWTKICHVLTYIYDSYSVWLVVLRVRVGWGYWPKANDYSSKWSGHKFKTGDKTSAAVTAGFPTYGMWRWSRVVVVY